MSRRFNKLFAGVAALAALALGGSALAGAATNGSSTAASGSTSQAAATAPANMPPHGGAAHEDSETAVTGANATKAKAAAVASVTGTAGEVTTTYDKNGYEVTVKKADGTTTEVHLDSAFNVQPGHGGPPPGTNG